MQIRKAELSDIAAIISLIKDFAEFENLSEYLTITAEVLSDALFGDSSFVEALVAEVDEAIAGYAIFYPHFSSFRGQKGYYLEDIYIDPKFRGHGIGEAMIREIAQLGGEKGYVRIDFQVLEWNTSAIEFYKNLGAQVDADERHFKFTDDVFAALAE